MRIEGPVTFTEAEESEEYFRRRPKQSQLSAYCSEQSRPIESLEKLEENFESAKKLFGDKDVTR